jgi:hypothetical protein
VRARLVLILMAVGLVLVAVLEGEGAGARSGGSRAASWGSLQVLAPASQYAFDPQLAVADDGQTLAAWFGGPRRPLPCAGMVCPRLAPWSGSEVLLDQGTIDGGFGAPVVVSAHGSDSPEGLQVAISGSGVAYAAWEEESGTWMISSASSGELFVGPRKLLPGREQLSSLVRSPAGPVAAVWFGPSSLLRYALLRPDGTLGPAITVGGGKGRSKERCSR